MLLGDFARFVAIKSSKMYQMRLLATFLSCFLLISWTQAQTKYLTIEPNHSTIGFEVSIASGATKITGKFMEHDLQLTYVNKDWTKSNIHFTIKAKSIDTNIEGRDEHLRSADFFDVEKYPEITFVSNQIERIDSSRYIANGTFTMHGVSNPMALPFEVTYEDDRDLGIHIDTVVNRIDYGVGTDFQHTSIPNFVSEEIGVKIDFWTKRDKRKG